MRPGRIDRIDLGIDVPAIPAEALAIGALTQSGNSKTVGTSVSADVRTQVSAARSLRTSRQGKPNARLAPREIEAHCAIDNTAAALLAQAMARLSLSARAYHRILKVARTIADLAGANTIRVPHVTEAIGYRRLDRM